MVRIIRKASMNKRTKQMAITIPKREFRKLNPKIKINKDTLFEIKIKERK